MTTFELPPEPPIGNRVRDGSAREWEHTNDGWTSPDSTSSGLSWGAVLAYCPQPLTLIEPEPKCGAHLNLRGEDFQCDLTPDHFGLGHSNGDTEAVWGPVPHAPLAEWEVELLDAFEKHEPDPWPTAPFVVAEGQVWFKNPATGWYYDAGDTDMRNTDEPFTGPVVPVGIHPVAEWGIALKSLDMWLKSGAPYDAMDFALTAAALVAATDALRLTP